MAKELCFMIGKKELYLEQVLVEYMDVPIFFLCKGGSQYYLVLCTDLDALGYVVVGLPVHEVSDLLHGRVPMRDVILHQQEYWEVVSGDEISMDVVNCHSMDDLDKALLPEEGACFEALTGEMEEYVEKFDQESQKEGEYWERIPYIDMSHLNLEIGTCFDLVGCFVVQPFTLPEVSQDVNYTKYCEEKVTLKVEEGIGSWSGDVIYNIAA